MRTFNKARCILVAALVKLNVCKPISLEVDPLLKNNSESCKGIKTPCEFEDGMAFTDSGDRINVLSKTLKP